MSRNTSANQPCGATGVARVAGAGYTAFLLGPAIIGSASHAWGIQQAMIVPLCTGVALALMALWMPSAGRPQG